MTDIKICINVLFKTIPGRNMVDTILRIIHKSGYDNNTESLFKGHSIHLNPEILSKHICVNLHEEKVSVFNLSLDFSWDEWIKSTKDLEKIKILDIRKAVAEKDFIEGNLINLIEKEIKATGATRLVTDSITAFAYVLEDKARISLKGTIATRNSLIL